MAKFLVVVVVLSVCGVGFAQDGQDICVRVRASNSLGVPVHPAPGDGQVSGRIADSSTAKRLGIDDETGWIHVRTQSIEGWITARYVTETFDCQSIESSGVAQPVAEEEANGASESMRVLPDLAGEALMRALRRDYTPTTRLSYHEARQAMFGVIDNDNGRVRLVYTGETIRTMTIPDHRVVNTEHSWPQSRFRDARQSNEIKCDIHHLYPTLNRVNAARANHAFAEIPDSLTSDWWASEDSISSPPPENTRDNYSESTDASFEPREDHKGNVARSMFYIFVIYGDRDINKTWFAAQVDTLLEWHRMDPVDDRERSRNIAVSNAQGNLNPFILDPSLSQRIFAN